MRTSAIHSKPALAKGRGKVAAEIAHHNMIDYTTTTNTIDYNDNYYPILNLSKKGDKLAPGDETEDNDCSDQAHWIFVGVLLGLSCGIFLLYLLNCFRLNPRPVENTLSVSV